MDILGTFVIVRASVLMTTTGRGAGSVSRGNRHGEAVLLGAGDQISLSAGIQPTRKACGCFMPRMLNPTLHCDTPVYEAVKGLSIKRLSGNYTARSVLCHISTTCLISSQTTTV